MRRFLSAAPDLALGASYLITWISPAALGARSVRYLTLMAIFEFLVIHSSAFMGIVIVADLSSRLVKAASVLGLGLFYSVLVGGFAAAFHEWWPVTAFWMLTLNRLTPVLLGTRSTDQEAATQAAGWAISVALYMLWVFATAVLPMPHLGVTPEVIAANRLPGEGVWVDEPFRLLAFGAAYYLSQGAVELLKGLMRGDA